MMRTQSALLVSVIGLMMGCGLLDQVSPGNGPGPNTSVGGLRIEASFGVDIKDGPGSTESPVSATFVTVQKQDGSGKMDVSKDAVLQVNGVTIPYNTTISAFDFSKVTIPNATPGSTVTLSATRGADSATFQVKCPDITLTAPEENTKVTEGQDVMVSWNGKLRYASGLLFGPQLKLKGYQAATNSIDPLGEAGKLTSDTSGTIKIPSADGKTGYIVELSVPGDNVSGDGGTGLCFVYRRRHLTK